MAMNVLILYNIIFVEYDHFSHRDASNIYMYPYDGS